MKRVELSISLALCMVGTVASLLVGNKKIHTAFGVARTVASLFHAYQYKKNIKNSAKKGFKKMNFLKAIGLPSSKLEWFLQSVEIGSYLPGRIRVYSKKLINNPELRNQVELSLLKYRELDKITVNSVSGSVLIEYNPVKIRGNKELCDIEEYIKKRSRK